MTNENQEFLQEIVDNTSELIFMLSIEGEFLFVNNALVEVSGYGRTELKDMSLQDMIHPEFKESIEKNLARVRNGEKISDFIMVFRTAERKRVYLSGEVTCRYMKGEAISFRCIFHDITQRRRAEIAQNLYHSIAQSNLNTKSLEDFLSQVHQNLQKNIYANNFFVAVYERESNTIYFPYQVDEKYKQNETYLKRNLGNGLIEYTMVKNKPLILNKQELENLIENEGVFLYETTVPAIIALVPLKFQDTTIGVIGIKSYSDESKFSSKDLELMEFVSGQIAISMQRKQSEEKLLLQTARLNAIFDSSTHFIWTANQKRQLSSFNKNYQNLIFEKLGVFPEIGSNIEKLSWKLIAPDDKPSIREKYNLAFQGQAQYFEMHWGDIDGGDNWFEFYLNPILSSERGEIEEVSGIARNITEKKNAILNIQKSEGKFRDIIESSIDIYYRTDLAGNITMISPSVYKHTGYTEDEVTNQKVDKFFEDAIDSSKGIKSLLKSGSITNFEVLVKRKDGELRQFMLNIRMIKDAKGIPVEVEGVARDISELKKSADELTIAKNDAEHSLKIKEQFLANMSHEIRTPMNGIIGMVDVLSETPLETTQKDYVKTIKKSSETLLTILNDILDLSKIEAGKMEILHVPFDLYDTLKNLTALFTQRAKEKGNKLIVNTHNEVPQYIEGDQIRLLQILSNLISNALKFTQNGSISLNTSIKKRMSEDIEILFEVVDTGMGISADNQKKLFSSFQQLDISTKKSFGGTGLGLVISKELCQKMGGKIGLKSELGVGSNFWFTIKTQASTAISIKNSLNTIEEIRVSNYFKDSSPRILLVDDNGVNRKVASEILKTANCEVVLADSGQAAIDIFTADQVFDLILMDIQMPEMDGIETTAILKEKFGKKLPVVVAMTAYSMPHDRENFLQKGMDDYVSKPIRANILIKKVEEHFKQNSKSKSKKIIIKEETIEVNRFDFEVINGLKEMVGAEMLSTVFEDFKNEATEQIQNSIAAFHKNDVITIQKELHTLKGNSGTIGLMGIFEITKTIEEPSKKGNLTDFEKHFKVLEAEFECFKTEYLNW